MALLDHISPWDPRLVLPEMGDQTPRVYCVPPKISTRGREAVELAEMAGLTMDPWEALALDELLGVQDDGRWASKEFGLIAGRQNGKDVVLEARELFGLFLAEDDELIIHSAHLFDTSLRHFQRVEELIMASPDLDRFLVTHKGSVSRSHGKEGFEIIRDGVKRELRFRTRTEGGGRGWTCDCLIFNEAMILSGVTVGAILPTLSAVPNPQVIYAGSAGMKHSTALGRLRRRGMRGEPRVSFLEWSAEECSQFCPENCEEHDQKRFKVRPGMTEEEIIRKTNRLIRSYAKANPGWGIRIGGVNDAQQSFEHIEAEKRQMDPEEFDRERLGLGDWPVEDDAWLVISEAAWKTCADPTSSPVAPVAFAIDMTPDRRYACIVVAGINQDGLAHIEITGADELDHRPGDRWVVARVEELIERWNPCAIVIDRASQAGSLIKDLEKDGSVMKRRGMEVTCPTARDYAQACGWFGSAIMTTNGQPQLLAHRDQLPMTLAVSGAAKRDLAELWAWDRKNTTTDISPLVAATLAVWGFQTKSSDHEPTAPWVVTR
jgi:hypothetical protein